MFSYDDYKEIIRIIQSTGRHCNYTEALHKEKFVIMRHGVQRGKSLSDGESGAEHGLHINVLFPVDE